MAPADAGRAGPAHPASSPLLQKAGVRAVPARNSKRSSNACARCRRQKIKCVGGSPCDACVRRKASCVFNDGDAKIIVTRSYIEQLQHRLARWEGRGTQQGYLLPDVSIDDQDDAASVVSPRPTDDETTLSRNYIQTPAASADIDGRPLTPATRPEPPEPPSRDDSDSDAPRLSNPLSAGPSQFTLSPAGRLFYFGTSSNWSFTRRISSMLHEHIHSAPLPTDDLLFDGQSYQLDWDGMRNSVVPPSPQLPTLDHAIYLINTVKFHCGQTFHLFDESSFMSDLYGFYESTDNQRVESQHGLWYIHFLLLIAFGKAFVNKRNLGDQPPGAEYFNKALSLLPDLLRLWQEPLLATEVLCCIALYLQCVDHRLVAYTYFGQAIRIAIGQGMHTNMPSQLGEALIERSRRIWWTTYIFDQEMTSLNGLPQSLNDADTCSKLPHFGGSTQRVAALNMQIKLARITSRVDRTVYGSDGSLHSTFLSAIKSVLKDVAGLADELGRTFPLQLEKSTMNVSRTSTSLHLGYHRSIILATRPLLFCFLRIRLESQQPISRTLQSSRSIRSLIQMCLDSSIQSILILQRLSSQWLLEAFLPFDLESLFVSTVTLLVAPTFDSQLHENSATWLKSAFTLFDELIDTGNRIASLRKTEVQRLLNMTDSLFDVIPEQQAQGSTAQQIGSSSCHEPAQATSCVTGGSIVHYSLPPSQPPLAQLQHHQQQQAPQTQTPISMSTSNLQTTDLQMPLLDANMSIDECYLGNFFSGAQILDVVASIDNGDNESMARAIIEHGGW